MIERRGRDGMLRLMRIAVVVIASTAALPAGSEVPRFAYVVNSYDNTLSGFIVDNRSGQLRHNGHVPVGKFPSSVVTHPSGKFVYVSQQTSMRVSGFAVDSMTGRLTPLPGSPYNPKISSPFWMATDPAGKYLYLAGRNSLNIGAMAINAQTGELTPVKGAPFPGGKMPRSVAVAPSGQFVYMTNIMDDNVSGYRIDPLTGTLTNLPGSPYAAGDAPQFIDIHPSGKFAFLTSWNTKSILTYAIDSVTGVLQRQNEFALGSKVFPFGIRLDSKGRHLYATDFFGGVMGFNVNIADGGLTAIVGSPFAAIGKLPATLVMEPSGQFAFSPNYDSHDITTYAVDSGTGALNALETTWSRPGPRAMAIVSGDKPVEFQPQSIYVTNADDNTLTAYRIDAENGSLKAVATRPTGINPTSVSVNTTGRYVYVTNAGSNTISAYQVDPTTGIPKEIPSSPIKTRNDPRSLALDYNDHYAYVANTAEHAMSIFVVDSTTGTLRELTQVDQPAIVFPRPAGVEPRSVLLHPASRFSYVVDATDSRVFVYRYYSAGPMADEISQDRIFFEVAKNPVALAADPRGKFLYLAHGSINALGVYSINIFNGEVKAVPGSPFPAGTSPTAVAVHPGGHYVYVANKGSNDITVYYADTAQSRFTRVGQVKSGAAPVAISVEGSGRFVYVTNEGSNTVSIYSIDSASGMLKEAGNIPTGAKPSALVVFTATR